MYYRILNRFAIKVYPHLQRIMKRRWHNQPFGNRPISTKDRYQHLWNVAKDIENKEIDQLENQMGYSVDKVWLDDLALVTQVSIKKSATDFAHGRMLYTTLRNYAESRIDPTGSITIIETGTARGFSSICMAKALHDANIPGKVLTFDVLPHDIKMYWNSITDHQKGPISRKNLIDQWRKLSENYIVFHEGVSAFEMAKIYVDRVNFAFLDAAHTYKDVIDEFNLIRDKQRTGDIIIFDDYNYQNFHGVVSAVNEICSNQMYEKRIIGSPSSRSYAIATKI